MLGSGHLAVWTIFLVGLFNSIMFPSIFTLGIAELGPLTGEGSGILIMAIVGGAIIPLGNGRAWCNALLAYIILYSCPQSAISTSSTTDLAAPESCAELNRDSGRAPRINLRSNGPAFRPRTFCGRGNASRFHTCSLPPSDARGASMCVRIDPLGQSSAPGYSFRKPRNGH